MILVTVGTHYQQFDRLVKGADNLSEDLDEKVVIQRGNSNYVPLIADHFQWTSSQQMESLTREARLVISQASAGAVIHSLRIGKPLVLVPRLKQYGENLDDHQLQLARKLASQRRAVIVDNPEPSALREAIEMVEQQIHPSPGENSLQYALRHQLDDWFGIVAAEGQQPD